MSASLEDIVARYSTVGTLLAPVDTGNLRRPHQAEVPPASDSRAGKLLASQDTSRPQVALHGLSGTVNSLLNSAPLHLIMTFSNLKIALGADVIPWQSELPAVRPWI